MATAQRDGRGHVSCIVWAGARTRNRCASGWQVAAGVPGFVGFAVGRTVWWEPLINWRAGKISRDAAANEIARRYGAFAATYEKARATGKAHAS